MSFLSIGDVFLLSFAGSVILLFVVWILSFIIAILDTYRDSKKLKTRRTNLISGNSIKKSVQECCFDSKLLRKFSVPLVDIQPIDSMLPIQRFCEFKLDIIGVGTGEDYRVVITVQPEPFPSSVRQSALAFAIQSRVARELSKLISRETMTDVVITEDDIAIVFDVPDKPQRL